MPIEKPDAPFAFSGLDRVFHERARLGIVTSLAGRPEGLPSRSSNGFVA